MEDLQIFVAGTGRWGNSQWLTFSSFPYSMWTDLCITRGSDSLIRSYRRGRRNVASQYLIIKSEAYPNRTP
eukprot:jgi/Botrbrau1/9972/Bobra.0012s0067.1